MDFISGKQVKIHGETKYYFIPKHRNNYPHVSRWIIGCKEEFDLAYESLVKKYNFDRFFWNTQRNNNQLVIIGLQNQNNEYIARFEMSEDEKIMHGYPIDHTRDPKQIPHSKVLAKLRDDKKISKRESLRISRGLKL